MGLYTELGAKEVGPVGKAVRTALTPFAASGAALAPTVTAAGAAATGVTPSGRFQPIKTAKKMLAADVATLQERPEELGLTESEKRTMAADAQAQADARAAAQMAEIQRTALAGQGFQQGTLQQMTQQAGAEAAKASTQATAAAEKMSRELIAAESRRIRAQLDAQRGRARELAGQVYGEAMGLAGTGADFLREEEIF